ncbi:MAG TPA: GNAT family N-acetyltransferase [Candidatus Eremiobacteraeota bacterium]|nr:MAG: putative acetyltransferase [bacterium ADurb.Bin363]HPZ07703.1 GNAT family N-acetyltransferase [Candidatus Eremiobacteraeota bacterium]
MNEKEPSKNKKINIITRHMEIDDLAKVFHLGEKLFTAEKVPTLYRTWDEYEVLTLYQGDSEFCLVAEEEEKEEIVGFTLGTTISKSHSAWKYGHLVWLGIDPDWQGQGIAKKLFDHFLDLMIEDGVRILLVDTESDNKKAINFFYKMGFKNPQDHVYLTLNLDNQRRQYREKEIYDH